MISFLLYLFLSIIATSQPTTTPDLYDQMIESIDRSLPYQLNTVYSLEKSGSSCSGAIDYDLYRSLSSELSLRKIRGGRGSNTSLLHRYIFVDQTAPVRARSLQLLNAGAGTTGTGGLKEILCNDLHLKSIHHMDRCTYGYRLPGHINKLVSWKSELLCCLGFADANYHNHQKHQRRCLRLKGERGEECRSHTFVKKLEEAMRISVIDRPLEALSDSPVDFLFEELYSLAPSALVIHSLRDPHMWARKRVHYHHRSEILCRKHLWDTEGVRHPFDVLACILKGGPVVSDSLLTFPQFNASLANEIDAKTAKNSDIGSNSSVAHEHIGNATIEERYIDFVSRAYIRMNTYNAALVPVDHLHLICMFDGDDGSGNTNHHNATLTRMKKELTSIWFPYKSMHFPPTAVHSSLHKTRRSS